MRESKINKAVAEHLRGLAGMRQKSVRQLAADAGLPEANVRRMLKGQVDISVSPLTAVSAALDVTARDVLAMALKSVGPQQAFDDVRQIAEERVSAKAERVSAAGATVTALHPEDMTVEQLESLPHAANYDPEAETDEPDPS